MGVVNRTSIYIVPIAADKLFLDIYERLGRGGMYTYAAGGGLHTVNSNHGCRVHDPQDLAPLIAFVKTCRIRNLHCYISDVEICRTGSDFIIRTVQYVEYTNL